MADWHKLATVVAGGAAVALLFFTLAQPSTPGAAGDDPAPTSPTFIEPAPQPEPLPGDSEEDGVDDQLTDDQLTDDQLADAEQGPGSEDFDRLPDGTAYEVRTEPELDEQVTSVSATIAVDLPNGTSPILGETRFHRRGVVPEAPEIEPVRGLLTVPTGDWSMTVLFDPEVMELLGPDAEQIILGSVASTASDGLPSIELSRPLRFAGDAEGSRSMLVEYQSFAVERGCGELALACSPTHSVQVVRLLDIQSAARAWQADDVTIRSPAPRPQDDLNYLDPGPLLPRDQHIVAWTGSELIVYGGHTRDSFGFFTDGAVYSPAARDWRPMSSPPDGTGSTSGVWTGSELLVVARAGTSLYHPGTDRWRQLPAGIDPGGIVWIDTAYVWNGDGVHRLDGEAWTPLDELPAGFAYTDRAQSQLLAVGGDLVALSATPSECGGHRIARYDGRQWRELPAATVDTSGPTPSCSYADGLASVGGHLVAWSGDRLPAIVLDPAAGRWLELAGGSPLLIGMSEPITGGLAVGEQLLVPSAPLGAVIDPGRDQLLAVELPGPGNPNEMVWTGNEVLMWGASQEHGSLAVPDAWRWTPPPAAG